MIADVRLQNQHQTTTSWRGGPYSETTYSTHARRWSGEEMPANMHSLQPVKANL